MRIPFVTVIGVLLASWAGTAMAERHALLVGVSDYAHVTALEGPRYDIAAMRRVLTGHWGFKPTNVAVVQDGEATRARILREVDRLRERTRPGDQVFVYMSGHGTSAADTNTKLPLPYTSGAFVPVEYQPGETPQQSVKRLVVGRRDLRPRFEKLDAAGRKLFVAIDACYSGNTVRGAYRSEPLPKRYVPPMAHGRQHAATRGAFPDGDELGGFGSSTKPQQAYPYESIVYVSAASEFEVASDISRNRLRRFPTIDQQPHGAFTDALLRAMSGSLNSDTNGDGRITYAELHESVRGFMRKRGFAHTPQRLPGDAEDTRDLARAPVLGASAAPGAQSSAPAVGESLRVRLEGAAQRWKNRLTPIDGVEIVGTRADLTLRVEVGDVLFITAAGDLMARLPASDGRRVVARVERQVAVHRIIEQRFNRQSFNVRLGLVGRRQGDVIFEGERIGFTFRSEKTAHLLLFNVDTHGNVNVIYPANRGELVPVDADVPLALKNLGVVTEPFGTEYLKLVAFERQPPELRALMGKEFAPDSLLFDKLQRLLDPGARGRAQITRQLISMPVP